MHEIHHEIREPRLEQSRVTAVFEDRALSFILARGATLEELSDRLCDLGRRQDGRPVAMSVTFAPPFSLADIDGIQPAGTDRIQTVDVALDDLSLLRLPPRFHDD